jgi:DsbC/DsbD-like thiol-disulfide interchange protein
MQSYQKKPEVFFDVSNEEHRLAAQYFIKNNAWGYPWIFVLEKGHRDITVMVKDKMLNFYIEKDKIHVG